MILTIDKYQFPIYITDTKWDDYIDICINLSCEPKPCIHITVEKNNPIAGINAIDYYESCSISAHPFKKGTGAMVVFIKASLKWLIEAYPYIKEVHLQDDSYYVDKPSKEELMLPEKMVLTEGQTWYESNISKTLKNYPSLASKELSGSGWFISCDTIKNYQSPSYEIADGGALIKPQSVLRCRLRPCRPKTI